MLPRSPTLIVAAPPPPRRPRPGSAPSRTPRPAGRSACPGRGTCRRNLWLLAARGPAPLPEQTRQPQHRQQCLVETLHLHLLVEEAQAIERPIRNLLAHLVQRQVDRLKEQRHRAWLQHPLRGHQPARLQRRFVSWLLTIDSHQSPSRSRGVDS